MKKLVYILLLFSLFLVSGCSNYGSRGADMKAQDSGEGDLIVEEVSNDPMETDSEVGAPAEDTGNPIPEELVGTWTATTGLPQELKSFSLQINSDQSVNQTTVDADDFTSEAPGKIIATESGYAIVNDSGIALLTLTYEDGKLKTEVLSTEPTILEKTQ